MYGFYNDGVWGGGNAMGWFGGGLMMIVFWAAIILFVVWLVREVSGSNKKQDGREHHGKAALEILKERYAKGEINKEEFESKKRDLS